MRVFVCAVSSLSLCLLIGRSPDVATVRAADKEPAKSTMKPVPVSMHDFMEGVFQAPYKRLKVGMAAEPKDAVAWKAIRSDALILAEGGNLLLTRLPEKDADLWSKYSVDSRDAGAIMVKEAKSKDFAATKKAYEMMLGHCNACHKKFENGKHILTP